MDKHVRIIAILYLVLSCLGLLTAIFLHYVLNLIGAISGDQDASLVLSIVSNVFAVILVVSAIPGIIGALGLLKFKEWSRILMIILSIVSLLNFPLGTILGIYTIWVLTHRETLPLFSPETTENANS